MISNDQAEVEITAPHFETPDIKLFAGDAERVSALLEPGSIDCIVTSPPYFGLRDYGIEGQIGLEASLDEYVSRLVSVFRSAREALSDRGTLWLNLGDSYAGSWGNQGRKSERGTQRPITGPMSQVVNDGRYPDAGSGTGRIKPGMPGPKNLIGVPWRVALALQADGWILRNAIVWHKPNAMPSSVRDRFVNAYEHIFLFSKSPRYHFDQDAVAETSVSDHPSGNGYKRPEQIARGGRGNAEPWTPKPTRNPRDVWTIPTKPYRGAHFAVFPEALVEKCVLAGSESGGTILDPFVGSGTTSVVARKLGRKSVGIDLQPEYIDLAVQRILSA